MAGSFRNGLIAPRRHVGPEVLWFRHAVRAHEMRIHNPRAVFVRLPTGRLGKQGSAREVIQNARRGCEPITNTRSFNMLDSRGHQSITNTAFGPQQFLATIGWLKFLSQVGHIHAQILRVLLRVRPPNLPQ